MDIIQGIITIIYYVLIAYTAVIMIYNFIKTRSWQQDVLYVIVLIPFLLRLFRLK